MSDFHGQRDPLNGVGGAAALSTHWQQDRANNPNTLLLTAGDAVGASPPLSSFFDDNPTIDFMNYAGFDADTFGNHNFDGAWPTCRPRSTARTSSTCRPTSPMSGKTSAA